MLLQQPSLSPKTLPNPFISHSNLPKNLLPQTAYHFRRTSFLLHASAASGDTKSLPQSAIQRIADKLRSLGYVEDNLSNQQPSPPEQTLTTSHGEIFVPLPNRLPKYRVGHTLDPSWSTPENPVPEPGSGNAIRRYHELRREVWKEKKEEKIKRRIEGNTESDNVPTMAELKVPRDELRRLRSVGIAIKKTLKIGKAGITEGIVNGIHERWRNTELVKIVCEDMCRLNMKRTHDLLERKTGGLVIWRSGSIIILYRGADYKYPYFFTNNTKPDDESVDSGGQESDPEGKNVISPGGQMETGQPPLIQGVGSRTRVRFQLPGEAQLAEEADQLLHGLGPRFTDWYGYDPLPVDADLLPAVVPGYRKPFRLLPFGVQPKLTNDEMTILRRLGRPLPCHFALGRNRKHQGLAAAILKLWEKCEIAKIAVKKGVQNTNSQLMAQEIQWLTGGTLLTRDKEYIVVYRGKDFLPAAVSSAIEQRRNREVERKKIPNSSENQNQIGEIRDQKLEISIEQRKQRSREAAIKKTSSKLSQALAEKEKAEKLLEELEKEEIKQPSEVDKEGITEEERYMLRKVGLKMGPFLLLGRRGVFDGTVENMHLHWKYRELVKILSGEMNIEEVYSVARTLEAESGGILVAVERVRKGHAIIVYRGKNYKRPDKLRPETLLNKRQALNRHIEAQRRQSLKLHVLKLGKNVEELKVKLAKSEENGEKDDNIQLEPEITSLLADFVEPNTDLEAYKSNPTSQDNERIDGQDQLKESSMRFKNKDNDVSKVSSIKDEYEINPVILDESEKTNSQNASDDFKPKVNGKPRRSALLSNKERLLLRKQALKMKKRPVLAVGRSNIVSGVAKTIKTHFQKYPLAIVNIKGRAQGTSAQELVSKLQEATGAILVSQEPNKVILYRGWGGPTQDSNEKQEPSDPLISPELISAIRLECGLQNNKVQQIQLVATTN